MSAEALERERRLQGYRQRYRSATSWSDEDIAALDWIDALAVSGHVGSERLLRRMLRDEQRLAAIHAAAPQRLHALAARLPKVAFFLVRVECAREQPDLAALERWLSQCDGVLPSFTAALADLRAAGATIGPADWVAMSRLLDGYWKHGSEMMFGFEEVHDLLLIFAKSRFDATDPAERAAGLALVKRAFDLGNREARDLVYRANFEKAEDKEAFYARWVDDCGNQGDQMRRACLMQGARVERAGAGQTEALEKAATWYWRAIYTHKKTQEPNLLAHVTFCERVGRALEPSEEIAKFADAELSKAWTQRAEEIRRRRSS